MFRRKMKQKAWFENKSPFCEEAAVSVNEHFQLLVQFSPQLTLKGLQPTI